MWGLREFGVLGLVLGVSWLSCCCRTASADIVLIGRNTTQSFRSVDAVFAPTVGPSGVRGRLYLADPLDACSELMSKADNRVNGSSPFVLVVRGGCSFWDKVRRAQEAGFVAVVVYNDENFGHLVASERIRLERPQVHHDREFHGMSIRLVDAMPSLVFTSDLDDNSTSQSCAICIEDYIVGEKLRMLPCRHKFHVSCVDLWLTSWRTFCPVCKRDARIPTGEPPESENTPLLLSSTLASMEPSPVLSSHAQSSLPSSPAIQMNRAHLPQSALQTYAPASMHTQQSFHSYWQSPSVARVSRSSVDLRNASSQMSQGSVYLASPLSVALAYPSLTPVNSRYMSSLASQSNASPSYLRHSYQQSTSHSSGSAMSFLPAASSRSLPERWCWHW